MFNTHSADSFSACHTVVCPTHITVAPCFRTCFFNCVLLLTHDKTCLRGYAAARHKCALNRPGNGCTPRQVWLWRYIGGRAACKGGKFRGKLILYFLCQRSPHFQAMTQHIVNAAVSSALPRQFIIHDPLKASSTLKGRLIQGKENIKTAFWKRAGWERVKCAFSCGFIRTIKEAVVF